MPYCLHNFFACGVTKPLDSSIVNGLSPALYLAKYSSVVKFLIRKDLNAPANLTYLNLATNSLLP